MGRKSEAIELNIFLQGDLVGKYTKGPQGLTSFSYNHAWVQSGFPISQILPLRTVPYKGENVRTWFENLLPDLKEERELIAAKLAADSSRPFDLLAKIGRDCVGALLFARIDEKNLEFKDKAPQGTVLTDSEIGEMIRNLKSWPLGMKINLEDFRISLAGVQQKTALLFWKNKWQRPIGITPTTHIIKPPISFKMGGYSFKSSVHNEYFCMKLCRKLGLNVANVDLKNFDGELVLAVERFDRYIEDGIIYRKHQEDMCQALGYFSNQKYQSDQGPNIKDFVSVLETSLKRKEDLETLFKSLVTYYALGAIDGHAKNYSLEYAKTGHQLTPLYDILSIFPALTIKEISAAKYKMALSLGNSNHYRANKIARRHFLETAKICQITEKRGAQIIDHILEQLKSEVWKTITYSDLFDSKVKDKIVRGIKIISQRLEK